MKGISWITVIKLIKQYGIYAIALCAMASHACAQEVIKLKIIKNIPVVKGVINGKEAYFIIDSGSSITLLNTEKSKYFHFSVVNNVYLDRYHITGLGGKCSLFDVTDAELRFGSLRLDFINKGCDLEKISKQFASAKIKIAGIIGSDVMSFLGSQICYADTTIVFHSNSRDPDQ